MKEEKKLTAAELRRQLKEAEAAERKERETYKEMVDETVRSLMPAIERCSEMLADCKNMVFDSFDHIIDLKADLYGIKSDQQTHTFTSADGKLRIKIGNRFTEDYDDSVDVGIAKVKQYLASLAKDEASGALVDTVMKLLAKDRQGNLRVARVVELEQIAIKSNNDGFLEGIKIIKEAYRPKKSCRFIEVSKRDEDGKDVYIPLAISSVE
ncbi:MAG: DUF3164 family protein [Bacteroidales bacterium]